MARGKGPAAHLACPSQMVRRKGRSHRTSGLVQVSRTSGKFGCGWLEKLHPDVQNRISGSPAISEIARNMAARDAEFAAQYGLPVREDVQRLREIMGQPGWQPTLAAMLKKAGPGGYSGLPGVVLAPLAYNALSGEER